jgi:integrase
MHQKSKIKIESGDNMADTKHLLKKGRTWYLNFTFPKRMKDPALAGRKIRISLQTPDLKVAQRWRDRHVYELLNAENELHLLECLAHKIVDADKRLEQKLEELLPDFAVRGLERKTGITLGELRGLYIAYLETRRNLKASSVEKYRSALDIFVFVLTPAFIVEDLTHQKIQEYASKALRLPISWSYKAADGNGFIDIVAQTENSPEAQRLLSKNSVRYSLEVAKGMYKWAIEDEKLPRGYVMPFKKLDLYIEATAQKHKRAPTNEEADALCSMPVPKSKLLGGLEWRLMPLIARYTGMRLGEVAQLHYEDIIEECGILCFKICRDTKTNASHRIVPVAEKLLPHIKELRQGPAKGRIFKSCGDLKHGKAVKFAHGFVKVWNRSAKGVSSDLSYHCWRVYANASMSKAAVDLLDRERLLGHANERTNAAYLPDDYERLKRALDHIY